MLASPDARTLRGTRVHSGALGATARLRAPAAGHVFLCWQCCAEYRAEYGERCNACEEPSVLRRIDLSASDPAADAAAAAAVAAAAAAAAEAAAAGRTPQRRRQRLGTLGLVREIQGVRLARHSSAQRHLKMACQVCAALGSPRRV